jgi:transcriptional accessory protein Tex/SPT6
MQIVTDTPMGYDAWHETVQKMLDRGADATDDQLQDIMDWLHRTMTTIDVNSADTDELQTVLGVSGRVAQAIVARRNSNRFADIADLKSVPGIDASIIDAKARLIFFH